MNATVTITPVEGTTDLFHPYPNQVDPQPTYLELNLETGELRCDYVGEVDGGVRPLAVFHGRALRWDIPPLTAAAANRLMRQVREMAQRILDEAQIRYDGNNHIGVLTNDAGAAVQEISRMTTGELWASADMVTEWAPADWFTDGDNDAVGMTGLTADTTDAELAAMVEKIRQEAEGVSDYGAVVQPGMADYLRELREELRAEVRNELAETARVLREAAPRRDELIQRVRGFGDSHRAIADRADLSDVGVKKILDKATRARAVEELNSYTGDNIWEDVIYRIPGYNSEATSRIDPSFSSDRFVAAGVTFVRREGEWVFVCN